jgi:hypothetical protein
MQVLVKSWQQPVKNFPGKPRSCRNLSPFLELTIWQPPTAGRLPDWLADEWLYSLQSTATCDRRDGQGGCLAGAGVSVGAMSLDIDLLSGHRKKGIGKLTGLEGVSPLDCMRPLHCQ